MRTGIVLVAVCVLFAALAPAASAQVAGEQQGVTVHRGQNGVVLRFADQAARLYRRRIAGRRVAIECSRLARRPGGYSITDSVTMLPRAPKRRARLQTGVPRGADLCTVRTTGRRRELVAWAALTERGRIYVDELVTVGLLQFPILLAPEGEPSVEEMVQAGKGLVVALPGPDATPPPGKAGVWVQGARRVLVAVTPRGRRLYIDTEGDDVRTNVLPYLIEDGP